MRCQAVIQPSTETGDGHNADSEGRSVKKTRERKGREICEKLRFGSNNGVGMIEPLWVKKCTL
jgi:hypothetical protein